MALRANRTNFHNSYFSGSSNDNGKHVSERNNMSNYKHLINQIVCRWSKVIRKRPLRILETHQGEGDGTSEYRKYGCVVSFEKDRETYNRMRKRFRDVFSLDVCLEEGQELGDIAEDYKTSIGFPILVPYFPTDSTAVMPRLRSHNYRFDVVDIDPYGSPRQFIPRAFELLDDRSILLITTGEMHSARFQPEESLSPYAVQANKSLRSTQKFFRTDNILILGAWVIQKGLEKSLGLYPIFIYDYYTGRSGVQRIGFFVRQQIVPIERSETRRQLILDPVLKATIIRCCVKANDADDPRKVWRFCDDALENQIEKFIRHRLNFLYREKKL